jgi:hypothetical protein
LLQVAPDGRHLLDANNQPFYLIGDSVWSLALSVTESDASYYFQQRAAQGFNSVLMDSVGLSSIFNGSSADQNGNVPFNGFLPGTNTYDVSTTPAPGDTTSSAGKYWQHIDNLINMASENGIVVVFDVYDTYSPWFQTDGRNGNSPSSTAQLQAYGQFLGQRYADDDNIIWMFGNDYLVSPEGNADMAAVMQGIRQFDNIHLITLMMDQAQGFPAAAFDNPTLRQYVTLNGIYLYNTGPYRPTFLGQYNRADFGPVFNMETGYENNFGIGSTPATVRSGHYGFLLNGAVGDLYGNERVGGAFSGGPFASDWKAQMNSQGAQEMTYFRNLLNSIAWHNLVPDQNGTVFQGVGTPTDFSGARSLDGTLAIAYRPPSGSGGQSFTVRMNQFAGLVTARWYDPTNGTFIDIGSGLANAGNRTFTSPNANSAGQNDFVLVLTAAPALAGDYNVDGTIDAADYVVWRKTLGSNVTAFSGADGDGDSRIDQDDHGVWRANFGQIMASPDLAPLLHIGPDGRHLLDPDNQPFYLVGDTAWSLALSVSESDASHYFEQRAAQGFNTVLMDSVGLSSLISGSSADQNGNVPFNGFLPGTSTYDVSTTPAPGDTTSSAGKYWQHIDNLINMASENGIQVVFNVYDTYSPWFQTNGRDGNSPSSTAQLQAYGQFLGQRYADDDNIIWMFGNGYLVSTEGNADMAAVIAGIRQFDSVHLITLLMDSAQGFPPAAFDNPTLRQYMTLNGIFLYNIGPYRPIYLEQYNRADFGPTFNMETGYENNSNIGSTPATVRSGHYSFLLNGAIGDLYGNERVGSAGPFAPDWKAQMNSQGAQEMTYFRNLLESVAWQNLVPDQNSTVFQGIGTSADYSGAWSPDGTLAIAYKPPNGTGGQSFTVHMNQFTGLVTARWYDPTNGTIVNAGSGLANSGNQTFTSPAANSAGQNDFVLVLEADEASPAIPSGLTTTSDNARIDLSWNAVIGATSYNIFRSTSPGGQSSSPYGTGISATSFIDTGLQEGRRFYYEVSAFNGAVQSGKSSKVSATSLIGDYNHNGNVDAADYVLWRRNLDTSVGPFFGADGDGDGMIDPDDHGVWRAQFGETLLQPSTETEIASRAFDQFSFEAAEQSIPERAQRSDMLAAGRQAASSLKAVTLGAKQFRHETVSAPLRRFSEGISQSVAENLLLLLALDHAATFSGQTDLRPENHRAGGHLIDHAPSNRIVDEALAAPFIEWR